jgi:hypothetical protein
MANYSDWEPKRVDVLDLQLDPLNPRLPALSADATERVIIEELLRHEDVTDLAKGIGAQGFYPTEVLVCVEAEDGLIVVEGNRRLASLKLLISPDLAPVGQVQRFRSLSDKYKSSVPTFINVVVAPSRSATVPLIMNKHTRTGVKSWEPLQQAQYVMSLLRENISLDELPELTGIPRADILNNLKTLSLYEMAKRLPLEESLRNVVADPRKFAASTLERVSGSPDFRKFLGIDFDDRGGVVGKIHPNEFQKAFSHVVSEIARKRLDTRKLNSADLIRTYIRSLNPVKPDPAKTGNFTSANFLVKEPPLSKRAKPTVAVPKSKKAQKCLISKSFRCNLSMERIKAVLWELQHLNVQEYENAVGVLLRIFIELPTSHYMEHSGQMNVLIEQINKGSKQPKGPQWTPTLRQMLGYLLAKDTQLQQALPRQAMRAINKALEDDKHPLSLDGMDQFVHNPYLSPSER